MLSVWGSYYHGWINLLGGPGGIFLLGPFYQPHLLGVSFEEQQKTKQKKNHKHV